MVKRVLVSLAYCVLVLVLTSCQTSTPTLTDQETPNPVVATDTLTPTDTPESPTPTPFVMTDPYPPALLDFSPRPGEEVSTTTDIQLVFDQPMDKDSVVQSFALFPESEGSFVWEDTTRVIFRPAHLDPETRYQVSLGTKAQSQDGLRLSDGYNFAFSTVSPLVVTQLSPIDGATELRGDAEVLLAFNRPVVLINCVGEDVQSSSECLELPLTFAPSVLGRAEWVNTSLYRFTPISGWGAGERYEVALDAGVMGLDGATLRDPVNWSFQTLPPRIDTVFPASGAEQVRLESTISVTFNTPMDQAITGREFSVVNDDETVVPGTIRWRDNGAVLIFTPTSLLDLDSTYTVQVSPRARARTSAPLENPFIWSFHTVPAPKLVRYTPDDGVTSVGINQPVQLDFVGAIDPKTLADNVRIEPAIDPSSLYTYFDEVSHVYNLRWDRQPREEYCVEVVSDIADVYGHTLEEGENFCFVTGDLLSRLGVPLATEMVTMDANEPSVLYLGARNAENIPFVLSEYDESAFISQKPFNGSDVLREWTEDFNLPPNESQLVPLYLRRLQGALPTGLYGLEWQLPGQNYSAQRLGIAVVDRHISIKLTREEALVWVTDLDSGDPITRTAVRLIDNQGLLIAGGTTDDEGLARIPVSPVDNLWNRVAAVIGTAGEPGFGIAMTQWTGEASPWNFGVHYSPGLKPEYRIFLETDRELYKPGQTLHFHGLLREDLDGTYQMPEADAQVNVTLHDVEMRPVYSKTLSLSAFGSFSGSVHLEDASSLGDYVINTAVFPQADRGSAQAFFGFGSSKRIRVEEYHKPPFQVEVGSDPVDVRQGQDLQFKVRAGYFSGEAVSDGFVEWMLSAEPYSPGFANLAKPGWRWSGYATGSSSQVITRGVGILDDSGMFILEFPADLAELKDDGQPASQRWVLKVLVTDRSQLPISDPVSAEGEATIHQADMYLGLRPKSWMVRARERVEIEVQAIGWEGESLPDREITAKLIRRTRASNDLENDSEATSDSIVSEMDLVTDADGHALAAFNPPRSGHYVVRVEGEDIEGNDIDAETVLWVSGEDSFVWRPTSDAVSLKPDAQTYEVGEIAQILAPVPFTGTYQLLLTVERANLLKVERLVFDQPNPVIELPIEASYAPNVYVSVLAVRPGTEERGPDVRAGYINLPVRPTQHLLDVSIDIDRDLYAPGDEARLSIRTLDHQGQPVDAEVSLSVVDKAMFVLRQTPEVDTIVDAFYGEHPLAVSSGDTMLVLINRLAEQLGALEGFAFAEGPAGMGGAQDSPSMLGVRQNFPDTAFWSSALRTGPDGQVTVKVQLPDSLTTWVARATAATQDTQVGNAELEIKVDQAVSIQPITPKFLVEGDHTEIVVVVHNRTTSDLDARVTIEAQGLRVEGNAAQEVVVPAQGQIPLLWALDASEDPASVARLSFSIDAGEYGDKVLGDAISIKRWDMPDVRGASGVLREAGDRIEVFHIPEDATTSSVLRLRLETSLAAGLIDQVDYLVDSSGYESTDALASRALTALAALDAMDGGEFADPENVQEARAVVAHAVECIQMRQNSDGGWGWWRDWSNLHMTSYIAMVLIRAEASGFSVSDRTMDRAVDYIETMMTRALQTDIRHPHFALAIRVLSQADRPWPSGAATILYRDRDQLGVAGRFHLALALGAVDPSDPRVATLLGDLQSEAKMSAGGVHWEEADSQHWATDIQVTALAVEAMTVLSPEDFLLSQTVRWLMNVREFNRWPTTYETAWACNSLANYVKAQAHPPGKFHFDIGVNGGSLLSHTDQIESKSDLGMEFELRLGSELQRGLNVLSITRDSGEGDLFYASSLHLFQSVDQISAQSRGMSINRQYCQYLPSDASSWSSPSIHLPIVPECSSVEKVAIGDIIEARLTVVVPATRHYVMLEDLFPAGFAPIQYPGSDVESMLRSARIANEETLDTEDGVGAGSSTSAVTGWLDPFERREYHRDRVSFFAQKLAPGTYQIRYRLRAEFPGIYHSLPATVSELYFPEVWGRTDAITLEILPVE